MKQYRFILEQEYRELQAYKIKCEALVRQLIRMDAAYKDVIREKRKNKHIP